MLVGAASEGDGNTAARQNNIDLTPYKTAAPPPSRPPAQTADESDLSSGTPRSIRVVARSAAGAMDRTFTIGRHPLIFGRKGAHIELEDAELSLRHCSILLRKDELVVRDDGSHSGTFLDGAEIDQASLDDGVHLLRIGSALLSIEPTEGEGEAVEPVRTGSLDPRDPPAHLVRKLQQAAATRPSRLVIVCVEGPASGQKFSIPEEGLVIGREGSVRVDDEFLSRRHFEIKSDAEGTLRIEDLGSRNGTFLNTLPARNTRVAAGDEIRAGNSCFKVEAVAIP